MHFYSLPWNLPSFRFYLKSWSHFFLFDHFYQEKTKSNYSSITADSLRSVSICIPLEILFFATDSQSNPLIFHVSKTFHCYRWEAMLFQSWPSGFVGVKLLVLSPFDVADSSCCFVWCAPSYSVWDGYRRLSYQLKLQLTCSWIFARNGKHSALP